MKTRGAGGVKLRREKSCAHLGAENCHDELVKLRGGTHKKDLGGTQSSIIGRGEETRDFWERNLSLETNN